MKKPVGEEWKRVGKDLLIYYGLEGELVDMLGDSKSYERVASEIGLIDFWNGPADKVIQSMCIWMKDFKEDPDKISDVLYNIAWIVQKISSTKDEKDKAEVRQAIGKLTDLLVEISKKYHPKPDEKPDEYVNFISRLREVAPPGDAKKFEEYVMAVKEKISESGSFESYRSVLERYSVEG